MTVQTMSTFFAVLSLACWVATAAVVALAGVVRLGGGDRTLAALQDVGEVALWAAWVVAATTTAGSLYYSLGAHYLPCELCWYQRICMYPLAIVLAVAAATRDRRVWRYVIGPAVIGTVIAVYHSQLQAYPAQRTFCASSNPCTTRYVWEFGFVSLPLMALSAFVFIIAMVLVARWDPTPPTEEPS